MTSRGSILLDTNLLLLLVAGLASPRIIGSHERLKSDYDADDFDLLAAFIGSFDEVVFLNGIVVEVDYFANKTRGPDRFLVLSRLRTFVNGAYEYPMRAQQAVNSGDFARLGFVDSLILEALWEARTRGLSLSFASNDALLVHTAVARGFDAILFKQLRGGG